MDSVLNESLCSLLLRLSEADGPSALWGRQAKPYLGPTLDRLLSAGILTEQAPADLWPTCPDCDCDLDVRPIQVIAGTIVAACPIDADRDTILDADDLRSFVIDGKRLVETIAAADPSLSLREATPGLWYLGATLTGRALFLTLKHSTASDPALLTVMRAAARGADIALIAPSLRNDVGQRFHDAGDVHVVAIGDAVSLDDTALFVLETAILSPPHDGTPRLVITQSNQRVMLDGSDKPVPHQPYKLLVLLTEWVIKGGGFVSTVDIEKANSGRQASDLVRELRNFLSADSTDPKSAKGLIKNRRNPSGYALTLSAEEIDLRA